MALLNYGQTLIIDRVTTGSISNICEQILGNTLSTNYNELATNALIEYMICQGFRTAIFKETETQWFASTPTSATFHANGKARLKDIIARMTAAGIEVGVEITGNSINHYKRVSDYNSGATAYQKIKHIRVSDTWWDLSGNSTTYETMRDNLVNALDSGTVSWGSDRCTITIDIGDARTIGDTFTGDSVTIAYDQLVDLDQAIAAQYVALNLVPNIGQSGSASFPGSTEQYLKYDFRCYQYQPNYDNIRLRMWKILSDVSLTATFQEPVYSSQTSNFVIGVSPETTTQNSTGLTNSSYNYSGYWFEGKDSLGTKVRNKKDTLAAFEYVNRDIYTAITSNTAMPLIGSAGYHNAFGAPIQSTVDFIYGDYWDFKNGRIEQLPTFPVNPVSKYENIQDTSPSFYSYDKEQVGYFPPPEIPVGAYTWLSGLDPWNHLNTEGTSISSQYFMRQLYALPHAPAIIDTVQYAAAASPQYTNKYTFTPNWNCLSVSQSANPWATPEQIPWGGITFPTISLGNISQYYKVINDQVPVVVTPTTNRWWWREYPDLSSNFGYTGATYTNAHAPNPTFPAGVQFGGVLNNNPHSIAIVVPSRDGRAIYWTSGMSTHSSLFLATALRDNTSQHMGFEIEFLPQPLSVTIHEGTPIACYGGTEILTAEGVGGVLPYTYAWYDGDPSAGGNLITTGDSLGAQPVGTYWVTVTDDDLVSYTTSFTITQPDPLSAIIGNYADNCCGIKPGIGFIEASVFGGSTPYSYLWSGPGSYNSTSLNIYDLTEGTYVLDVTDANGCTISTSQVIGAGCPDTIIVTSTGELNTCGTGTVTISLNPTTQLGNFDTVLWSNGDVDVSSIIVDTPGSYTCTGFIGTCFTTSAAVTVLPATPLSVTADTQNDNICGSGIPNAGALNATPTGGCSPYTFIWTGPSGYTSTNQNITNLISGTYTVLITDNNGDTAAAIGVVSTSSYTLELDNSPALTCANDTTDIYSTNIGGIAPYTYTALKNGVSTSIDSNGVITSATAGIYTVTSTDANGCSATTSTTITQNGATIVDSFVLTDSTVGASTGSITLGNIIGNGPFTYLWSTGETTKNISGLSSGVYTVQITDVNDCTITASYSIYNGTAQLDFTQIKIFAYHLQCCLSNMTLKYIRRVKAGSEIDKCFENQIKYGYMVLNFLLALDGEFGYCDTDSDTINAYIQQVSEFCDCDCCDSDEQEVPVRYNEDTDLFEDIS